MKRTKNKIATIRLKKNRIKNINKLNQSVVIHLAKSHAKSHKLRTTNAPIIRRYYAPTPQPLQESFQTNKTLESVGNTLRELKAEQNILRNQLNSEQQTAKERNPITNPPMLLKKRIIMSRLIRRLPRNTTEREREDNDINKGFSPMLPKNLNMEQENNNINKGISPMTPKSTKPKEEEITPQSRALILELQPTRRKFPKIEREAKILIQTIQNTAEKKLKKKKPI